MAAVTGGTTSRISFFHSQYVEGFNIEGISGNDPVSLTSTSATIRSFDYANENGMVLKITGLAICGRLI